MCHKEIDTDKRIFDKKQKIEDFFISAFRRCRNETAGTLGLAVRREFGSSVEVPWFFVPVPVPLPVPVFFCVCDNRVSIETILKSISRPDEIGGDLTSSKRLQTSKTAAHSVADLEAMR